MARRKQTNQTSTEDKSMDSSKETEQQTTDQEQQSTETQAPTEEQSTTETGSTEATEQQQAGDESAAGTDTEQTAAAGEQTAPETQTQTTESGASSPDDTQASTETQEQEGSDDDQADVPEFLLAIAENLRVYIEKMGPTQIMSPQDLAKTQLLLRNAINNVLRLNDEQFAEGMRVLIATIRDHRKDVFSDRMVFRGFPQMKIGASDRKRFETLVSLLTSAADSKNPKKVSDIVDMSIALRYVPDNDEKQKLESYFS